MTAIIMSTYNGEKYLSEQLDSILTQKGEEGRLYLFDDGSKDRTEEIALSYVKRYEGRVFFEKNPENLGAKGSFFHALINVFRKEGEAVSYYSFSDQDDVWDEDKLSLSLEALKKCEDGGKTPALVYSDVRITDSKLKVLAPSYFEAERVDGKKNDFASLLMENKMIGGTVVFNRALMRLFAESVKRIGGLPAEAKMHDWWFGLLAASFGKVSFIERATESYRQHENNVVGGETFLRYLKKRLSKVREIRGRIEENIAQGEAFQRYYGEGLSEKERKILEAFIAIKKSDFLKKRRLILQYGFYKTGLIRNLALMIFV